MSETGLRPAKQIRISSIWAAMEHCVSAATLTWLMLWLGINTGPWVIRHPSDGFVGHLHYIRTIVPLLFFGVGSAVLLYQETLSNVIKGPVRLWLIYGLLGVVSGWASSLNLLSATYWGVTYLSAFVWLRLFIHGEDAVNKTIQLNWWSWVLMVIFLSGLVVFAKDALFVDTRWGLSGYGVVQRVGSIGEMPMSRASGMARFAAVPAVVSFVFLFRDRGFRRLLWAIPFVLGAALVYLMQSRGAILGLGFAIGFVMLFLGSRSRLIGLAFMVTFAVLLYSETISKEKIELEKDRFYRGMTEERFRTLTGRTLMWKRAWKKIKKAPILGYGPQADRHVLKGHVHNTYLYALLEAGFVGAAAFVGGLVWAWVLFFRAILRRTADALGQRDFLIQAGGILAFFTVRSVPEVCGAMFGVDFLVMLPILAYLTVLDQHGRNGELSGRG